MTTDTVNTINLSTLEALVSKPVFPMPAEQTLGDFREAAKELQVRLKEAHSSNKEHRCWSKGYIEIAAKELLAQHRTSVERAEKYSGVVLHFRRVDPTVTGDWNDRLATIDAEKRFIIREKRAKYKEDTEHVCHSKAYVPSEYIKAWTALVTEVLTTTLAKVDGITVGDSQLELSDKGQLATMIQLFFRNGLAPDAFVLAIAAQTPSLKDFLL